MLLSFAVNERHKDAEDTKEAVRAVFDLGCLPQAGP
jgi:hypothetical protein